MQWARWFQPLVAVLAVKAVVAVGIGAFGAALRALVAIVTHGLSGYVQAATSGVEGKPLTEPDWGFVVFGHGDTSTDIGAVRGNLLDLAQAGPTAVSPDFDPITCGWILDSFMVVFHGMGLPLRSGCRIQSWCCTWGAVCFRPALSDTAG